MLVVVAAVLGLLAGIGAVWQFRGAPVPAAPAIRPNVLLITLDTTRADRLGSYGYAGASTPNLDRLAAAGVRFNRALSSAPLTLPAHASVMTGRHPYTHGVRNNGHFTLADDVPTLAASFEAAGYETAAFVSSFVLDRQFGLARGFMRYDDALDQAPPGGFTSLELERRGDRTVAAASEWLTSRSSRAATQPFFLWVHLYDRAPPLRAAVAVPRTACRPSLRRGDRLRRRAGRGAAAARGLWERGHDGRWWRVTTARAWATTVKARTGCSSTRPRCGCR